MSTGYVPVRGVAAAALVALWIGTPPGPAGGEEPTDAAAIERRVERVERLLNAWQLVEAQQLAERLLKAHPDMPAVQLVAGWVKFHLGEHRSAAELVDRAGRAFGDRLERDGRVALVRAMARITDGFVRRSSPDGKVEVWHGRGVDEILVPDLIDCVQRTLQVVGEDLGFRPRHTVVVQVLPDDEALADVTGLTVSEIRTTGTIAVCKFGRLMLISPRSTLMGYSFLDTVSHELVHLIISEKTHNRTPIWLHEALAKYEDSRWRAGEPLYRPGLAPARQSRLKKALHADELISFEQMYPSMARLPSREAAELAFSEVYSVTAFLLDRQGYAGIRKLLDGLFRGLSDMQAIEEVYGLDGERFVRAWLDWLREREFVELKGSADLADERQSRKKSGSFGERALTRSRRVDLRDHFHLGQLLRARGRLSASLVEYDKARRKAGSRHLGLWVIAVKLGQVLSALGRGEQARESFESSLRMHPDGLEAHLRLGRLLIEHEPYRAFLHLREAYRRNPLDPRAHRGLAVVCQQLAEQGDAREDFAALALRHRAASKIVGRLAPKNQKDDRQAGATAVGERTAALRILTRPWARVWLDFVDTGLSTPIYRLPVQPGRHVLGLKADCLERPEVIRVELDQGELEVIDRDLCPDQRTDRAAAR